MNRIFFFAAAVAAAVASIPATARAQMSPPASVAPVATAASPTPTPTPTPLLVVPPRDASVVVDGSGRAALDCDDGAGATVTVRAGAVTVRPRRRPRRCDAAEDYCGTDRCDVRPPDSIASPYALPALESPQLTYPDLSGPTDYPDGAATRLGGFQSSMATKLHWDNFTIDPATAYGLFLGSGVERRHFISAFDLAFALGSFSAEKPVPSTPWTPASTLSGTGTIFASALDFRLGPRLPLGYVALAAGGGLGASVIGFIPDSSSTALAGINAHVLADVPLWASVELKPSCDWGIELQASYQVHPSDTQANQLLVGANFVFENSEACTAAGLGID